MADHSWQPIDLTSLPERPPRLPVPNRLYYPGARHLWSGEPESGKSWAAVIACAHELDQGNSALYLDFEADEYQARDRFLALGLQDYELDQLVYMRPSDGYATKGVRETITEIMTAKPITLIIIDAYAGALDIHELDPFKAADIEKFNRAVIDPIRTLAGADAATIILDHVVKDRENRGRFSTGSERKVGVVDVHLGFTVTTPFGRGRKGLFTITVHKDRPGWLPRPTIGVLELTSDPDTHQITWQIRQTTEDGQRFRPTALMERVSRYLEERQVAASQNTILKEVSGKERYLRAAIETLIDEGYVHEETGARHARLASSQKPYREALDTTETDDHTTSAPPPPTSARADVTTSVPTSAPLSRGGGAGGGGQADVNGATSARTQEPIFDDSDIPF